MAQADNILALLNPCGSNGAHSQFGGIDWQEVWHFCSFHGVRPALWQALECWDQSLACPEWLIRELTGFRRRHAFRVMQMTGEIVTLAKALDEAEIIAVFFKGATLGEQIYGGAQHREFNDIDLLVAPAERGRAEDLLEEHGFAPVIADRSFRRAFYDYSGQHMFRHRESGSVVDLHWNFVGNRNFPVQATEVLDNRVFLSFSGSPVPAPSIQDLALILAGHGQKEGWASFGWALDFAQFVQSEPNFDWARVAERAKAQGSKRCLLTAFQLMKQEFGIVVHERLLSEAMTWPQIVAEADQIYQRHEGLAERNLADDIMGSFRLCETPLQRAHVWFDLLTTRTIGDYESLPLPRALWWVYYLTRPFRLAWAKLSGGGPSEATLTAAQRGSAAEQ